MNRYFFSNKQDKISYDEELVSLIKNCCDAVADNRKIPRPCEISVIFADNDYIRKLNLKARGIDRVTDVLSFPIMDYDENYVPLYEELTCDGMYILGDMVISLEKAEEQAKEYGHSFKREVAFLCVHSMLHLLGYDHIESEQPMFKIQEEILDDMEIKR